MSFSYQGPRRDKQTQDRTYSQSTEANLSTDTATVNHLIRRKGNQVFSIRPEDTLGTAVEILRDRRVGALLVTNNTGKLVGILSERDIVRKLADTPGQTLPQRVDEVMTSKVEVCAPTDTLVSVLRRMTDGRFRHMPVMDADNLIGMVTIGDVVHYRLAEVEHEALQLKQLIVG